MKHRNRQTGPGRPLVGVIAISVVLVLAALLAPAEQRSVSAAPTAAIVGVVTDAATGLPVGGVRVHGRAGEQDAITPVATGPDGTYSITGLEPGDYHVLFEATETYRSEWFDGSHDGSDATQLTLEDGETATANADLDVGAAVGGVVTDTASGAPAPGVKVTASGPSSSRETTTAADGSYTISGLDPGDHTLFFEPADTYRKEYFDGAFDLAEATTVSLALGVPVTANADLESGAVISGVVTDEATGAPLEGVSVETFGPGYPSTSTSADGTYALSGIEPGQYLVSFADPEGAYISEWFDDVTDGDFSSVRTVTAALDTPAVADAALAQAALVSGAVRDGSGEPLEGIEAVVSDPVTGQQQGWTTTDANGSYTVTELLAGSSVVKFGDPTSVYRAEWHDDAADEADATPVALVAGETTTLADAVLEQTESIAGTVTDQVTGLPLEGVQVTAVDAVTAISVGSATTTADGGYRVFGLSPGSYKMSYSSATHAPEWYADAPDQESATVVPVGIDDAVVGINVALVEGGRISGTVTGEDGSPLQGIWVTVSNGTSFTKNAATDAEGTYSVSGLPAGSYRVHFLDWFGTRQDVWFDDAADEASANAVEVNLGEESGGIDAVLADKASISGTVTDAAGDPIQGIDVTVRGESGSVYGAQTGSDGTYTAAGLEAGSYVVKFVDWQGRYLPEWHDDAVDEQSATSVLVDGGAPVSGINAALDRPGSISGTVTDADGAGIEGVTVNVNDTTTYAPRSAVTGPDGSYTVAGLTAGTYLIAFDTAGLDFVAEWFEDAPDYWTASPVSLTSGQERVGLDAVLDTAGSVSGTVTSASGEPVGGVHVRVLGEGIPSTGSATSGPDGSYIVRGLAEGLHMVHFEDDGSTYVSQWYENASDRESATPVAVVSGTSTAGINASLAVAASISGVVTDVDGVGIAGVSASVYRDGLYVDSALSGVDGSYRVGGLAAGSYTVRFDVYGDDSDYFAEWFENAADRASATEVVLGEGEARQDVDASLRGASSMLGTVTDAAGDPIEGVLVGVYEEGSSGSRGQRTGSDGSYRIGGLEAGSYTVEFWDSQGRFLVEWFDNATDRASATEVVLGEGEARQDVDASLTAASSISGTVTDSAGDPIEGVLVEVYEEGSNGSRGQRTGSDGSYRIGGFEPGSYAVEFRDLQGRFLDEWFDNAADRASATEVVLGEGEARDDVDTSLTSASSISGAVTDAAGDPIESVRVAVYEDGSYVTRASTGLDGSYWVGGLAAGSYRVQFTDPEGRLSFEWFENTADRASATEVVLGEGEALGDVDASLTAAASVSGLVTDGMGVPIPGVSASVYRDGLFVDSALSAVDGSYRVGGLAAGSYTVQFAVYGSEYFAEWFDNAADRASATEVVLGEGEARGDVDASLTAASSISGTVTDSAGDPIENASVIYWKVGSSIGRGRSTGSDGSYRIGGLEAGVYRVSFSDSQGQFLREWFDNAADRASATEIVLGEGEARDDVDASLETAFSSISGVVMDESRTPIEGVRVGVYEDGSYVRDTLSDSDGTYRVGGLEAGSYTVRFSDNENRFIGEWFDDAPDADTAATLEVRSGRSVDGVDASLRRALSSISGTVTDSAGDPIERVSVGLYEGGSYVAGGVTAEDGSYRISRLEAGSYAVRFSHVWGWFSEEWFDDAPDPATATEVQVGEVKSVVDVDASLRDSSSISGTVTDAAGDPIEGVSVRVYEDGSYAASAGTGLDGSYRIRGLEAGSYTVQFSDWSEQRPARFVAEWFDDAPDASTASEVMVGAGEPVGEIDASLTPSSSISGMVTDAAGDPIGGVSVRVYEDGSYVADARTGLDGSYRVGGLEAGSYTVQFSDSYSGRFLDEWFDDARDAATATEVEVGEAESIIGVDASSGGIASSISGTVTDSAGDPIEGVLVRVYGGGSYAAYTWTGLGGSYRVGGLAAGSYTVSFNVYRRDSDYLGEWFDNAPDAATATEVEVGEAQSVPGIDASLSDAASISGTVTDSAGDPIEGVSVWVYEDGSYVANAWTKLDGSYRVQGMEAGSYTVRFDGRGRHLDEWFDDALEVTSATELEIGKAESALGVDASLSDAASISGVVADGAGDPIGGVSVQVYEDGSTVASGYTGSDGSYRVGGLAAGSYTVRFSRWRWLEEWFDDAPDGATATEVEVREAESVADIRAQLRPAGTVSGAVRTTNGSPAVGVRVIASGPSSSSDFTDEDGQYLIEGLDPGSYTVQFTSPNNQYISEYYDNELSVDGATRIDIVPESIVTDIDAELASYGSISGTAVDASGDPIQGLTVEAWDQPYRSNRYSRSRVWTAADGTYELFGLTTGSYTVRFVDTQHRYVTQWFGGVDDQTDSAIVPVSLHEQTAGTDIAMPPAGSISGAVVDALGAPIRGATVSVHVPGVGYRDVTTDRDGTYVINGLDSGSYHVTASASGYETQTFQGANVTRGAVTSGVDVVLRQLGSIAGLINNEVGSPISGMRVELWSGHSGSHVDDTLTDAAGRYRFADLPSGEWSIVAIDPDEIHLTTWHGGSRQRSASTLVLSAFGAETQADLRMGFAGSVEGTVTDADGNPLNRARVRVLSNDLTVNRSVFTDISGEFRVGDLHTDTYVLEFSLSRFVTEYYDDETDKSAASFVDVAQGEPTTGLDADLETVVGQGDGTISGTVSSEGEGVLEGVEVTAYRSANGTPRYVRSSRTGANGDYILPDLPPDVYFLKFSSPIHQDEWHDDVVQQGDAAPVVVAESADITGVDATLAAGGTVHGRVTDVAGAPLAGVVVTLLGLQDTTRTTDEDGRYSAEGLEPGLYQAQFRDPTERFFVEYFDDQLDPRDADDLEVVSGEVAVADSVLDNPTASVSGSVVDLNGDPVPYATVRLMVASNRWAASTSTDGGGRFSFVGQPPDRYWVKVEGRDALASNWFGGSVLFADATAIDAVGGQPIANVDVVLPPRATVEGRVTNAAGAPLSSVPVTAYSPDEGFAKVGSTTTNVLGYFSLNPSSLADVVLFFGRSGQYLSEYYEDETGRSDARRVELKPGEATDGIVGVLSDNHPPQATLGADRTVGFGPLEVTFDVTTSDLDGDPVAYQLSFGDGSDVVIGSSPGESVTHVFQEPRVYMVRLEAIDALGSDEEYQRITVLEPAPIVADAGTERVGGEGLPIRFYGSGSTPEELIDTYAWDFGDGSSGSGKIASHTYAEAGSYTVTLTVSALGVETTDTSSVVVLPAGDGTGLDVTVVGSNGSPIGGAIASIELPSGGEARSVTNSDGLAQIAGLEDGTYAVAVAQIGYLPKIVNAIVRDGSGAIEVLLAKGVLAEAEVTVEPATLEEILAAGVDVNDPANQNVQAFELEVVGVPRVYFSDSAGWIGYGANGALPRCVGATCTIGFSGLGYSISMTISDDRESVVVMTTPAEASWLKEFFNVELAVYSNAPEGFSFEGGAATLDLPPGLSLADTDEPQSLTVAMPDVPAGGESRHTWLVRGDEAGEYPISATYRGALDPTGLRIGPLTAKTSTPLKVWGLDAIDFLIEADNRVDELSPYHMRVGMKNVSDVPVYNARIEFGEPDGTDYWYQPEQQLVHTQQEIPPGETFWSDEVILIDNHLDGQPLAFDEVTVQVSGLKTDEYEITELDPPARRALGATSTENQVDLEWEPIEGAAGYEIYELNRDLVEWVLLKSLDATATNTTIDDLSPGEESVYAVSTVVDSRKRLFHNAVESEGEVVECGERGHHSGLYWLGASPESPANCSALLGGSTVKWRVFSSEGPVTLSVESDDQGTASCSASADDETHATLECALTAVSAQPTGLRVTATDRLGTSTRKYTVVPDEDWRTLSSWALNTADDIEPFFPSTAEKLRTLVGDMGGDPAEIRRAALHRYLLLIGEGRSMRPYIELQIDLGLQAAAASLDSAMGFLFEWKLDQAIGDFIDEHVLLNILTSMATMDGALVRVGEEAVSGLGPYMSELVFTEVLTAFVEGRTDFFADRFDLGIDAWLTHFGDGVMSYEGEVSRPRAETVSLATDYLDLGVSTSADTLYSLGLAELFSSLNCSQCTGIVGVVIDLARKAAEVLTGVLTGGVSTIPLRHFDMTTDGVYTAAYGAASGSMLLMPAGALTRLKNDGEQLGLKPAPGSSAEAQTLRYGNISSLSVGAPPAGGSDRDVVQSSAIVMVTAESVDVTRSGVPVTTDPLAGVVVVEGPGIWVAVGPSAELAGIAISTTGATDAHFAAGLGSREDEPIHGGQATTVGIDRIFVPGSPEPLVPSGQPIGIPDSAVVERGDSVVIDVLANDYDPEGEEFTAVLVDPPEFGRVESLGDGRRFVYRADSPFCGEDRFAYAAVSDSGESFPTNVEVEVVCSGGVPPVAVDDHVETFEDEPIGIDVTTNDQDSDGDLDAGSVRITEEPTKGSVSLRTDTSVLYTPGENLNGTDSFDYEVCDLSGLCDVARVFLSVVPVNDAPRAVDDDAFVREDTVLQIDVLGNDGDPDEDELAVLFVADPPHGSSDISDDAVRYDPDHDWCGMDFFEYTIADPGGLESSARVVIDVACVNDPPVARNDSYATDWNTRLEVAAPGVLGNDSDVDGDQLTVVDYDLPDRGSLVLGSDGSLEYLPLGDWSGTTEVSYKVADPDGAESTAELEIEVRECEATNEECPDAQPPLLDLEASGSVNVALSIEAEDLEQWKPAMDRLGLRMLKAKTQDAAQRQLQLSVHRLWITGIVQGSIRFDDPDGGRSIDAGIVGVQTQNDDGTTTISAVWFDRGWPPRVGLLRLTINTS